MILIIFFNGYSNFAHAVIPDDVHVLDNSDTQTNKYIIQIIDEAWHTSVYGAFKIYTDATGSKQLEQSFVNNTFWYIGTESRHSNIELESLKHYVSQFKTFLKPQSRTPTLQIFLPLDQRLELQQRIFNFSYCKNAHLKFLLTWDKQKPILLLGTTTGDCVERDYHDNLIQHWYGADHNSIDFMVVIRSPYLISQFTRHLINYLSDKVAMSVKQAYADVLSTIITPNAEDLKTVFAWGPEYHRQQLLDLINDAQVSIKILQQDLTDPSMQQALRNAAHKGIKIQIIMSQTPFARTQQNKALPFLQELTKIGNSLSNSVTCQLTGCKGFESLPVRHIHAKFLAIDNKQVYVGSANFYEPVLDPNGQNLNVGIITTDARYTQPLLTIFDNLQTSAGSRFVDQ